MSGMRALLAIGVVAAMCAAACGKSAKEPVAEPRMTGPRAASYASTGAGAASPDGLAALELALFGPINKPAREPERAVYSLVDNRLSAHLSRGGGLLIPAGSAGFAKYTRFANLMRGAAKTWQIRRSEGGVAVARLAGRSGTVFVPLTVAQAARGSLRLRAFATGSTSLAVRVNDHKDITGALARGWSTVELAIPAGQLKDGENALQLTTSAPGVELAWLQIGGAAAVPDDGAIAFYDRNRRALLLPRDGQMTWYVAIPDAAKLTGEVADGCAVAVTATGEDGSTARGTLAGTSATVDLSPLAGKAARLELASTGCAVAALAGAALTVPGKPAAPRHPEPPKYVLFIIMDSLRADRVHTFNPAARAATPNLDKLAETSTVFTANYVQGNESQVSHASIWTSSYLAKHHAAGMSDRLGDDWVTIDKVAKRGGKFVAGASANGYIRPARGFGSAWDRFSNHIEKDLGLRGADLIDHGFSFLSPRKDQPWFLYLGLIDTHVTWRAKQPWLDRYDGGYKGRFATAFGDDGPGGVPKDITDREKDHIRALYDANVSYQDALLGQIIDKLEAWGDWPSTLLIVTADHGDELWESGRLGHGGSLTETLLHVPLLVHYPAAFPAVRVAEGTESIDLVPTIAELLGVPLDPAWQGASLVALANGGGGYPLLSFSSQYEDAHGGRIGHWKLRLMGAESPQLFDLTRDPGEHRDLWSKPEAEIGARLLLDPMWLLRSFNIEWKKSQWGNAAAVTSRFASDLGE